MVRELSVRDGVMLLVGSSVRNVEAPGVRCECVRASKAMGSGVNGVSWDGSMSELVVSGGTGHSEFMASSQVRARGESEFVR